ncbi:MAG TPA: hypothetical protein VGW36_06445 [Pyrinomonadaceae bacterium]|nr:hypothetical protein [Pyrinomonadaceae bacterium]
MREKLVISKTSRYPNCLTEKYLGKTFQGDVFEGYYAGENVKKKWPGCHLGELVFHYFQRAVYDARCQPHGCALKFAQTRRKATLFSLRRLTL